MEIIAKSPHELIAQTVDAHPYSVAYDHGLPDDHGAQQRLLTDQLKTDVQTLAVSELAESELRTGLEEVRQRAVEVGIWDASEGRGTEERLSYGVNQNMSYGFSEEQATVLALRRLRDTGYVGQVRRQRQSLELQFKNPTVEYIGSHPIDSVAEQQEVEHLRARTVDLTKPLATEQARLSEAFPSGNFVYHGARTEQVVSIIDSGVIANSKALEERAQHATDAGRPHASVWTNSGYEGVSWSMNTIDALPGDRYHMAGFIAAPETVLSGSDQFVVPSRPSPNEVLQITDGIDAKEFYDAKIQAELYRDNVAIGEANSVYGNLMAVVRERMGKSHSWDTEPMLSVAERTLLAQPDYRRQLRNKYELRPDGSTKFSSELSQQTDDAIPVAAVWLQAAIDTGRLEKTVFAGKDVPAIIDSLSDENAGVLFAFIKEDVRATEGIIEQAEQSVGTVEIPVESLYFVAPRRDAATWLQVFARSQHKPAGILLYDDKKVRLENFASSHQGDHVELTRELQTVISPDNKGYIDYSDVLGTELADGMRAGNRQHVIADKYLGNRRSLKQIQGKLVVE